MAYLEGIKTTVKPTSWAPNTIYFVLQGDVSETYITDNSGNPKPVGNTELVQNLLDQYENQRLSIHVSDRNNPHRVTKSQVGLPDADNTSDINKPISTATQIALDGKVDNIRVLTDVPEDAVFTDTVYSLFTELNDTPIAIDPLKSLRGNAAGTALEFVEAVSQSDVTQHESALLITSSQILDFDQLRTYVHDQGIPSLVWSINHNLDKYPSAAAIDTAKTVVVGQIEYIDLNNLTITFNASFSGEAYIN
jgi:hypothetical protein